MGDVVWRSARARSRDGTTSPAPGRDAVAVGAGALRAVDGGPLRRPRRLARAVLEPRRRAGCRSMPPAAGRQDRGCADAAGGLADEESMRRVQRRTAAVARSRCRPCVSESTCWSTSCTMRTCGEAGEQPRPARDLPADRQRRHWSAATRRGPLTCGRPAVGVVLVGPDGDQVVARKPADGPSVTVSGDPVELTLVAFGRQRSRPWTTPSDAAAVAVLVNASIAV